MSCLLAPLIVAGSEVLLRDSLLSRFKRIWFVVGGRAPKGLNFCYSGIYLNNKSSELGTERKYLNYKSTHHICTVHISTDHANST